MRKQPEIGLWAAVLHRAIQDLDVPEESTKSLAWIKSLSEQPGSFLFVADVLNQDPRDLRCRILQGRKEKKHPFQNAA